MRRALSILAVMAFAACDCGGGGGGGAGNQAPVLAPIGARTVRELETLTFSVHASDAPGSTLTLSASGLPAGAAFQSAGGDGTFTWPTVEGDVGVYQVTFEASDGERSDQEVVQVSVTHRAPRLPAAAAPGPSTFLQFVPNQDPDGHQYLPGAANFWDLDRDFALLDGGDDQFNGALELHVGTAEDPLDDPMFPLDQAHAEIAFSTPRVGAADGLAPIALDVPPWAGSGAYSAWISGTSGSRLAQVVDLTGATAPITLSFIDNAITGQSQIPSPDDAYRVVLRDGSGALLEAFIDDVASSGWHSFTIPASHAGQAVTLSFELVGGAYDAAAIDDVSVQSGGVEHVVNGDFETGDLTGWVASVAGQSSNLTSGSREVGGLTVTRSFYTLPTQRWARWVDVFENPGATTLSVNASYLSVLGSAGAGVVFESTDRRWLSAFDGMAEGRDVGWVFGSLGDADTTVRFASATALGASDGSPDLWVVFPLIVPAGGKVAIVNYLVLTGVDTGSLAGTTIATPPAEVEAVNAAILAGWGVDPVYQDYMTPEQLRAVVNF